MFYLEPFIHHLQFEKRFSKHTVEAYQNDLSQFIAFMQDGQSLPDITEVKHFHIRTWMMEMLEAGRSTKTINRKLSCLKTYYHYLLKHKHVEHNPMLKVSTPKVAKRLPSVVQASQMDQLFRLVEFGNDFSGVRNRLILETLYGTGIRRQELIGLKLQDVMMERRLIKVLGKGGKERLVPIPTYLAQVIEEYLGVRKAEFAEGAENYLFLTDQGKMLYPKLVYNIVYKYLSMVSSADQRSPHTLRHSFATHLSDQGADLNAIKTLLGHSSLAATQVYMHNSVSRLKKVYDQAHPKSKSEDDQEP